LGATTSGRDVAAEDITAVYSAFWAGLPAGQIRVKLRDSDSGYSDEIEISTQGLPRLFTQFRARALAEGRVSADRPAEPSHYLAVYDLWKRRDSRDFQGFAPALPRNRRARSKSLQRELSP
jgi:hypothetical protein